jgi:hypothetical protein
MEVRVETSSTDAHSGMVGGSMPNPNQVLARLLAGLHDERSGRVTAPGFYDVSHRGREGSSVCLFHS